MSWSADRRWGRSLRLALALWYGLIGAGAASWHTLEHGEGARNAPCEACTDERALGDAPLLVAVCDPGAPCGDPNHKHHNHGRPHDESTCGVCRHTGTPAVAVAAPDLTSTTTCVDSAVPPLTGRPSSAALGLPSSRAPPLPA